MLLDVWRSSVSDNSKIVDNQLKARLIDVTVFTPSYSSSSVWYRPISWYYCLRCDWVAV